MMSNTEHDLLIALRKATWALTTNAEGWHKRAVVAQAQRMLRQHDPEWTCPVCDGGPGNNCACSCPES